MMWRFCVALCFVLALLAPTTVGLIVTGILVDGGKEEPWGELAFLSLVLTGMASIALGANIEHGWPEKPMKLSRAGKKELRKMQDRAILDRSIAQLEREVRS